DVVLGPEHAVEAGGDQLVPIRLVVEPRHGILPGDHDLLALLARAVLVRQVTILPPVVAAVEVRDWVAPDVLDLEQVGLWERRERLLARVLVRVPEAVRGK